MGPVERAARVHGHELGLRQVPGDGVRAGQSGRPNWGLRDGAGPAKGVDRVRDTVLHRGVAGEFCF